MLITVTTPDASDRYIIARAPGLHEFAAAGIAFEGTMAMVRGGVDGPEFVGILGGKRLRIAGLTVTADRPTEASLRHLRGRWVIGDGKGTITVTEH